MTVSCICCVWCSIAHGYSFVYFRLMGCVCFAVNFYFYVYRTCVWVCVFAIAYLLCILCASMCAHISAAEISNYLFILDLAEAYTIQGNFFQPRPCFLLPFLLSSLLLLSLRRYTFMPTSFLWKTLISDWIASVIHQHLWISNNKNYSSLMHIAHKCVAFVGCQLPSKFGCHHDIPICYAEHYDFLMVLRGEKKIIQTSIMFDRFSLHFIVDSNSIESDVRRVGLLLLQMSRIM